MDSKNNFSNIKVVVVDDDDDSRAMLCHYIKKLGCQVFEFSSGPQLLDAGLEGQGLKVAFIDLIMPEMNGYDLLAHIRKIDSFDDMLVIMSTSKSKPSEVLEGYSHGADYYITKPYTKEQIVFGLNLVLNQE